jgi:hypothetical protein
MRRRNHRFQAGTVRALRLRDAAVAATRGALVRAEFSFPVFRLLPENDCSPGFKAV